MTNRLPELTQFRAELQSSGLIHLVFDCPDRSMNVFSNKAIHELGAFAEWLHKADVRGVVIRSDKPTGFCAGADLTELGVAYDMIVAAPQADRFDIAFSHFFPLNHALRRLETAGKPVAAAIAGVALGGGCELTLACHYRIATSSARAVLGLPECAVGLLPGAGGTQRMPRLVGVELGLEVLLQGRNLQGAEAVSAGLIDAIVEDGQEVAAAEAWLLSEAAHSIQPWDRQRCLPPSHGEYAAVIERHRQRELTRMLGHEPAPLAILDCVELGLMQPLDGAIRSEMAVFARLIQRPEPRNMIRTMFLNKQAWERAKRAGEIAPELEHADQQIRSAVRACVERTPELARAGFLDGGDVMIAQHRAGEDYWLVGKPALAREIADLAANCAEITAYLTSAQRDQLDYRLAADAVVPAYLGGVTGLSVLAADMLK